MKSLKPQDVYVVEISKPAPNGDNLTLVGPKIPAGKVVRIHMLYVIDITTANKTLRVGYDRGGTKWWAKREAAGASGYQLAQNQTMILVENEAPAGMIESPTTSDVCKLIARGVYL